MASGNWDVLGAGVEGLMRDKVMRVEVVDRSGEELVTRVIGNGENG